MVVLPHVVPLVPIAITLRVVVILVVLMCMAVAIGAVLLVLLLLAPVLVLVYLRIVHILDAVIALLNRRITVLTARLSFAR